MATSSNSGTLCPAGLHSIDPGWDECPYCAGERRSDRQTAFKRSEPEFDNRQRNSTMVGNSGGAGNGRETKVMPQQTPSRNAGGYGGRGDTRRVRGFIITYSWHPQGDFFPIREGKNYLGSSTVNREPGDPACDILISDDQKLSAAHALILCRQGRFDIVDLESTNGTFIDGDMLPIQGAELRETNNLKTGDTVWSFMIVNLPGATTAASAESPRHVHPEPKHEEVFVSSHGRETIIPK